MLKTVYLMKMIKYNQKDEGLAEFTPKAVLILTSCSPSQREVVFRQLINHTVLHCAPHFKCSAICLKLCNYKLHTTSSCSVLYWPAFIHCSAPGTQFHKCASLHLVFIALSIYSLACYRIAEK